VALALAVLGAEGCLWAPDIHEGTETPGGTGPTIDREKVLPTLDVVDRKFEGTLTFDVAAAISHPTIPAEQLYYYWFLNFAWQPEGVKFPWYAEGRGRTSLILNPCTPRVKTWGVTEFQATALELFVFTTNEIGETPVVAVDENKRSITGPYAYVEWWLGASGKPCPE
jgi:hypothetical protein